jgi:hypothetical protein
MIFHPPLGSVLFACAEHAWARMLNCWAGVARQRRQQTSIFLQTMCNTAKLKKTSCSIHSMCSRTSSPGHLCSDGPHNDCLHAYLHAGPRVARRQSAPVWTQLPTVGQRALIEAPAAVWPFHSELETSIPVPCLRRSDRQQQRPSTDAHRRGIATTAPRSLTAVQRL